MDKKKKLHTKVMSLFLSLLMVLSTILGYIPASVVPVQAAGSVGLSAIKKGTNITKLVDGFNSAEDVLIKMRKPVAYTAKNVDNDTSPYQNTGIQIWQKIKNIKPGKMPSITYYKAGYDKKNKKYYNLTATLKSYKVETVSHLDAKTGKKIDPFLGFETNQVGFNTLGNVSLNYDFTWSEYAESPDGGHASKPISDPSKFYSYVTIKDLDYDQALKIPSQGDNVKAYKLSGTDHIYENDGFIRSKKAYTTAYEEKGWVTILVGKSATWNMHFYERVADIGKPITEVGLRPYGLPNSCYFGYSADSIIDFEPPHEPDPTPEPGVPVTPNGATIDKRVGEKGASWGMAKPAEDREEAYTIQDYEEFDYLVKANGPNSEVDKYEITDTLEACLAIDDAAHVTVTDNSGKNVTGNFDVNVAGNTVTCTAKESYLSKPEFLNQSFTVRYTVHRIKTENVYDFMAPWIDGEDGYTFYVPNIANVMWHDSKNGTKQAESNQSWVTDQIGCELVIEKDAKYDDWKVGDLVTYAVEVSQVKQDGYAKNLVISDTDIPSCLKLVNNEWTVDGPSYGEAASISSDGSNGWIVTCPLLQYNDSVKVEFKCLVTEEANGKDWINTATAYADNSFDEYGDQNSVSDSAEVWVNSPVLTVDKAANAYEYEVGDTVRYTVTVNNTADYTIAENVVVSDITLPEGLELQGDVNVDMGEAKTSIGWPVKDGTTTISKETKENAVTVEPETTPYGNSWTVKAKYLPSQQPMQITFNCKATKTVNGIESQNVVTATADNFLSLDQNQEPQTAQDDAEVYVNTAAFDIEKTTPDYEWQVGDHVPFDITVRNINDENTQTLADDPKYADLSDEERAKIGAAGKTVARNVVITDKDIPDGFILDFDTVDVTASPSAQAEEEVLKALDEMGQEPSGTTAEEEVLDALEAMGQEEPEVDTAQSVEEEVLAGLENIGADTTADPFMEPQADTDEIPASSEEEALLAEINAMMDTDEPGTDGQTTDPEVILPDPEYPENHTPRPAEPMTVTGIPESYENHIAGTPERPNEVDEQFWNETETKEITWDLQQEGNGWKLLISDLPAGHDVNVHFTCEATQAGNGQEGVNIGTITADNAISKSDDSEAYVNTASLSIDKQLVNKYAGGGAEDAQDGREDYEFRVGEDVEYKLILNNTQKGSIARNVVVSDVTIPEGLELDMGSITVEGLPEMFTNPVAGTLDEGNQIDKEHYKETEILPISYEIVQVQNGFQVKIDNLPCTTGDTLNNLNQPVVITYHCTPTELVNGFEIINTGKAAADNASEVKDNERIWVNSPVLIVDKEADRTEYLPGDTITYRVDLIQDRTGCLARNITFHDFIDTPGVKLQKNSIVLIDSEGYVIQPKNVIINEDNSFTIETGKNLIKEEGYTSIDLDKADEESGETGWTQNGAFNPPNVTRESKLSLEYAVEIVDGELAGQKIHNKITANSDENIPAEDEAEVPVYGPALDIEKVSDKAEYQVGEEALYKLTIRNIREDTIVKQVMIEDGFEKAGMKISKINVRLNGKNIEVRDIVQDSDNHFLIKTGIDMNDTDKLEVFYKVVFTDPELHEQDIINVAMAQGENTDPEYQDNCVHIVDETPGLSIKKSSDKQEYKVGDTGHYTVVVKNTEKDTVARNVIIKDQIYVDGAEIVKDSIVIRNDAGKVMDDAEIQFSDTGYAIFTGHDLEYKDEMTVTYDVVFKKATLAGQDILNIARATCDNLRVETEDPSPITLPNGLTVHKSADPVTGSVVKNGEEIVYSVNIKNDSNADMKNVLVKDMIPEYTTYIASDEQEGVISGTRVLDGKEYATFIIESLAAGEEKTVSFHVMVTDAPEEEMIFNVAQVRVTRFDVEDMDDTTWTHESFRNTNEVVHYTDTRWIKDEHIVHIDGGQLEVDKVSDKTNYSVGETGHYTVTVRQKVKGAVARNVMVSDEIQKNGAVIQRGSIKAYILREGAEEEDELKDIIVTAKDQKYIVQTGSNLKYGEKIVIRYDVLFESAELEGQQVKNIATARDDSTPEGEEPKDDNRVTVGDAGLIIEKSSDNYHYEVGDVGKYVLKVMCSDPARTIENVVIKDVVKQQGAHLVTGTVRTFYDSEELKVNVQEKDNGFVVETNHDLSGTHVMWVKYDVVFESPLLNGKDVENIATTWGDNTTPTDDENIVHVGEGDVPDRPDWPDKPDKPDKPEPTPTPDPSPDKGMNITKTANKHDVTVGDIVSYTLEAKVNSGSDTAKNVVITDTIDPELAKHVEIIKDSFRSYLDNAEFHGESLNITEGGFTLKTGKNLAPGQVIKVTYDVKMVSDELKGQTVKNTATVSADNMDTAKDKEAVNVKKDDPREGGITLTKAANKPQVQVGETVAYTLEARVNSGTDTAKNVVIKDSFDSSVAKYVKIDKDSFRCYIDHTAFQPKSLSLTNDGFTLITGKDLKPGQVLKVTYDVKMVSDELKGKNVKNSAEVSSDNMEPGKDNEVVTVEKDKPTTGGIDLTKTSDRSQINIGETVRYTLTAKTTSNDTAQNVVIKDTLDENVILDKSSIKVYLNNQAFTPEKLNVVSNGFTMETGKDLAPGQTMKVVYDVRFASESLGGKTVKNTAVIDADNMDPVDDSNNIKVNKPAPEAAPELSIDKVANISEAEVGDSVKYVVTVKQTVKGQKAEQVVVTDSFDTSGMKVKEIRATLNGKSINVSTTKTGNGFIVNTGVDLEYGSTLKITYLATVSSKSLKGDEVRNTAVAESDNTEPVSAEAGVSIKADPEIIPNDNDQNDNDQNNNGVKPDDTTNTIGPKTGLTNNAGVYAGIGIGILAIAAIAVYVMRRRKKK